jgi:hypothetical protein
MGLTSSRGSIIIEHPSSGVGSFLTGKLKLGLLFLRDTIKVKNNGAKQCKETSWPSSKA